MLAPTRAGTSCGCKIILGDYLMDLQRFVIAVVDDDSDVRHAMKLVLSAFGYRAELFESAEEFIDAATAIDAACLLVDIQLGGISGLELGRHLSTIGFDFPIIFMTGSPDEMIQRQALDFGCVAYLRKPFRTEQLIAAVRKAIGHEARPQMRGTPST
jgi:FixJ family two-component response regulator